MNNVRSYLTYNTYQRIGNINDKITARVMNSVGTCFVDSVIIMTDIVAERTTGEVDEFVSENLVPTKSINRFIVKNIHNTIRSLQLYHDDVV